MVSILTPSESNVYSQWDSAYHTTPSESNMYLNASISINIQSLFGRGVKNVLFIKNRFVRFIDYPERVTYL